MKIDVSTKTNVSYSSMINEFRQDDETGRDTEIR